MADQKLTNRDFLETSSSKALIHVVEDGDSYKQEKASFLKDVAGYNGNTNVSAIWETGLTFNVSADSYVINGKTYTSTSGQVTLDEADVSLDRIDLIVAVAPVLPDTVGTVGKITGTPASSELVVPPDYDPSLVYVIKQVIVKAGQTTPFNTTNTTVFDEGTEWTVTYPIGYSLVSSDAYNGTNHIYGLNVAINDKLTFTSASPVLYENIDLITFYVKFTNPTYLIGANITLNFLVSGVSIKQVTKYKDITIGAYTKITFTKDELGVFSGAFNQLQIVPSIGLSYTWYVDYIQLHQGSGSENANLNISQFINDVPYVKWSEISGSGTLVVEELTNPIDAFQGNRISPINDVNGYINDVNINGATGYLSKNISTGANAYTGFIATTGNIYTQGFSLTHFNSGYFQPYLRNNTLLYGTDDLIFIAGKNDSNIKFRLGNSATSLLTEVGTDEILSLNADRTILAPSLTPALIISGGNSSLITKEYGDANYLGSGSSFSEFLTSTGTRLGGDLMTTIGDYDDSGNGTKLLIDDSNYLTQHLSNTEFFGETKIMGGNSLFFCNPLGTHFTSLTRESPSSTNFSITIPDANGKIVVSTTVPLTATSTGTVGQVAYDNSYFYVCTATNTWVRTALATW